MAMKEDAESLDEVVVIGYGTAKSRLNWNCQHEESAKDFNQGSVVSAQNLITGKVAGLL